MALKRKNENAKKKPQPVDDADFDLNESNREVNDLLREPIQSTLPSPSDAVECFRVYENLSKRSGIASGIKLKKHLPHFIKIAWISKRSGKDQVQYIKRAVEHLVGMNNEFPLPSLLHAEGVVELVSLADAKPDAAVLGYKKALHLAKTNRFLKLEEDSNYHAAVERLKCLDLANANFDIHYVDFRLAQVGEERPDWLAKAMKEHDRRERLRLTELDDLVGDGDAVEFDDLGEIEDLDLNDDFGGDHVER